MRFQPRLGRMLAAAGDTLVSIIDVETQACTLKLQVCCELPDTIYDIIGIDF